MNENTIEKPKDSLYRGGVGGWNKCKPHLTWPCLHNVMVMRTETVENLGIIKVLLLNKDYNFIYFT